MGHKKEKKSERESDPILKARQVRLKALRVMEKEAAEKDGKTIAPKVSIWWKILEGEHEGVRFWDNYSFVKSFDDETQYVIREGTRIGDLAAFMAYAYHDGADYFDSDVEVDFEDLEGDEVIASLEPRRFKEEAPTGTRTVSTTLMRPQVAEKVAAKAEAEEEADFSDIPF
jgi:hypothetical protein